jgi:hypothetical protein
VALPVAIAVGDHWLISDPVVEWRPEFVNTDPPTVVLTATVQAGPKPPIFPTYGEATTTLAIQMDAGVAIQLYQKLGLNPLHGLANLPNRGVLDFHRAALIPLLAGGLQEQHH